MEINKSPLLIENEETEYGTQQFSNQQCSSTEYSAVQLYWVFGSSALLRVQQFSVTECLSLQQFRCTSDSQHFYYNLPHTSYGRYLYLSTRCQGRPRMVLFHQDRYNLKKRPWSTRFKDNLNDNLSSIFKDYSHCRNQLMERSSKYLVYIRWLVMVMMKTCMTRGKDRGTSETTPFYDIELRIKTRYF